MDWHPPQQQRLEGSARWYVLLLAAGLMGLLGVARGLQPDPRGYGTHTQLGLRPCAFASLTGRPCPSCGMTTAWAYLTRGRLKDSWQANPAGCLIALLVPPLVAWLLLCCWLKIPVGFRSMDRPLLAVLAAIVLASLAVWILRILGAPLNLGLAGLPPVLGLR
jgi:hypothetical protein